ncbi:MAG: histone deacetylase family protein [Candidatus Micrarchaeota archaeon]
MNIVYSPIFLRHSLGKTHPECPARLEVILKELKAHMKIEIIEPSPASEGDLSIIHDKGYLKTLENLSKLQRAFPDNVFSNETYDIARLAAGAAYDAALLSKDRFAYANIRPPGHHAGKNSFAGFCYINNIAYAVRKMQLSGKAKRALIVDFDLHHGNGTFDIFEDDPSVFYLSFHQDPGTTYPGTGFESEGNSHMRNIVLKEGITENEYMRSFEINLKDAFDSHKPDIIGVSAGFDTYGMDPMGSRLRISDASIYHELGKAIMKCNIPTFAVLEGGYYLPTLGKMVYEFLRAFGE